MENQRIVADTLSGKGESMTKEEILDYFKDINGAYNNCNMHDDLSRMLDELLKEQQQKTGHWKRTGRKNVYGGIEIVCSVCDDHVMVQNVGDELFCRHCGAEMTK